MLVIAAAGGVGQFAVQMATRSRGAQVTASQAPANHDFLRTLGAARCIDYRVAGWHEALRDFDLVLDGAGGGARDQSWHALRPGGLLVAIAMPPADPASRVSERLPRATAQVVPNGERLRRSRRSSSRGELKVSMDSDVHAR